MPVSKYLPETILQKMAISVARVLAKTKITPNQITVGSFFLFIPLAMYLFAQGSYLFNVIALVLCYLASLFDYVDGEVARLKGMSSPLGEWLDPALDWIFMNGILFAIVFGVWRQDPGLLRLAVGLGCLFALNISSFLSAEFNRKFNFSSATAPKFLEKLAHKRLNKKDLLIKNILVPRSLLFAPLFTNRYLVTLGVIFNCLFIVLIVLIFTLSIRWILMFYLFLRCLGKRREESLIVKTLKEMKKGV